MSNLKELIDHLYEEITQQLPPHEKTEDSASVHPDSDIDVEKLRQTLIQMADALQPDDLIGLRSATPLPATEANQLLLQWDSICSSIIGLKRHMQQLEADIVRMQPWGDFDVVKLVQLRQYDCQVRFWTISRSIFATLSNEPWFTEHQAMLINEDANETYFVTISIDNELPPMPAETHEVEICPCPVSTLIMLQTRDKDSLKRLLTRQGDFALAHYYELRETLRNLLPKGATLPEQKQSHRQQLKAKLRKIFRK